MHSADLPRHSILSACLSDNCFTISSASSTAIFSAPSICLIQYHLIFHIIRHVFSSRTLTYRKCDNIFRTQNIFFCLSENLPGLFHPKKQPSFNFLPTALIPYTFKTISVCSQITGSCSAGVLTGRRSLRLPLEAVHLVHG